MYTAPSHSRSGHLVSPVDVLLHRLLLSAQFRVCKDSDCMRHQVTCDRVTWCHLVDVLLHPLPVVRRAARLDA
jgi:hypothetical protein